MPDGDPARLAGAGRHRVADHLAADPALRGPGHRHRHDPGAVPGDRRGGAAGRGRPRRLVRFDPDGLLSEITALPMQIYSLTSQSQEEFQAGGLGRHHRAAGHDPRPQRAWPSSSATSSSEPGEEIPHVTNARHRHHARSEPYQRRTRWSTRQRPASAERELPDVPPDPVMEARDLNVFYGDFHAVHDVNLDVRQERDHRADRPVGLRQVDRAALPEPDERPGRRRPRRGQGDLPRPEHLRARASTRSRSAPTSAWCSRSPTRSRSRSTTTSPTARGSPA